MTRLLKEVAEQFYENLKAIRSHMDSFGNNIELDTKNNIDAKEGTVEIIDDVILKLKSSFYEKSSVYGLLDELDDKTLILNLPWDAERCQKNINSLKNEFRKQYIPMEDHDNKRITVYEKCLEIITKRKMHPIHIANLDGSYNLLTSFYVLEELNKINPHRNKPYGFEFERSAQSNRLVENFSRVSLSILGR